jgi:ribonuclease G
MEAFGVDQEIRSTLSRRVDLPSGGYLIFDYAEAFTVIDVNTGRFVGGRGKNSGGRLEDTITKNNLEAVKEVVRQLRLRDIGGIIVIDFIDMANPKNRATVEEALRSELERDRTKTYVVEISPLGLVEMTRQNVTDGPREVMTRKCPTCAGDGIVYSEASAAIDVERRLRSLAAGSKSQAFRVELSAPIASALVGPGARRLIELEALTKRRFFLEGKPSMHNDHLVVLAEGKLAELAPQAPVEEGAELTIELVEIDRHDGAAAVGKLDGLDVCVGEAAELVGKKVKVKIERVLDGTAYATLVRRTKQGPEPLTAEAEAEKPTRKPPARKAPGAAVDGQAPDGMDDVAEEAEDAEEAPAAEAAEPASSEPVSSEPGADAEEDADEEHAAGTEPAAAGAPAKKKTRRGSRGGKNRKKPAGAAAPTADEPDADEANADEPDAEADAAADEAEVKPAAAPRARTPRTQTPRTQTSRSVTIHVPSDEFGRDGEDEEADGAEPSAEQSADGTAAPAKKKTRRGSRGGKNRKRPTGAGAAAAASNGAEPADEAADEQPEPAPLDLPLPGPVPDEPLPGELEPEPTVEDEPEEEAEAVTAAGDDGDWGYVPMSEWGDDLKPSR